MPRSNVIIRKPTTGAPSISVLALAVSTALAVGGVSTIASPRRVPTGLSATATAAGVTTDPAGSGIADASIVPALGRTVWNPGIYEGIPTDSSTGRADGCGGATQHGSTISAGAGLLSTINNAIAAAGAVATKASRRFVKLGPGTFTGLNGAIQMHPFVTLRGTMNANGFTRDTVLRFSMSSGSMIKFRDDADKPQSQADWGTIRSIAPDALRGDSTVTVNDATGINPGDLITVDHLRDGPANYPGIDQYPAVYDPPNDGNWVWTGDQGSLMRLAPPVSNDNVSDWPSSAGGHRPINEVHEVLAKNGNVLTIYNPNAPVIKGSPIRRDLYKTPQAYLCRGTSSDVNRYIGLEDLKIEPSSTNGNTVITLSQCAYCWIKNVEIHGDNPNTTFTGPGVWMELGAQTYRCEVTGCYFHGFDQYGPGGAYGIEWQGSDHYVHNNVFRLASKPINFRVSGGGNVCAYNYVDEAKLADNWEELAIGTHAAFCHDELIEGNWTQNMGSDGTHGNNGYMTFFRNYARGSRSSSGSGPPPNGHLRAVNIGGFNREMYSIGNVLLDPVLVDNTAVLIDDKGPIPEGPSPDNAVYLIGWAPVMLGRNGNDGEWDDGQAGDLFHRHLDFDAFTGTQYDNPSNPVKTLPPSLHRTTAPSYFTAGGYTWPWVNPAAGSHATRVLTLPAKARYDAGQA